MQSRFVAFSALFSLILLWSSCSKPYKLERKVAPEQGYEVWQGYFRLKNGVQTPLLLAVESNTKPAQLRIFSGSELAHNSYWNHHKDSVVFQGGLYSEFKGVRKEDKVTGIYYDGGSEKVARASFAIEKVATHQFPYTVLPNPANFDLTGTWTLDFGEKMTLSDLSQTLRYTIDRLTTLEFYSDGYTLLGRGYGAQGIQGFDGVMTKDGFIAWSFHHAEPFLMEATFIDETTFKAKINSTTDEFTLVGKRKSKQLENLAYTGSSFKSMYKILKAYFQ